MKQVFKDYLDYQDKIYIPEGSDIIIVKTSYSYLVGFIDRSKRTILRRIPLQKEVSTHLAPYCKFRNSFISLRKKTFISIRYLIIDSVGEIENLITSKKIKSTKVRSNNIISTIKGSPNYFKFPVDLLYNLPRYFCILEYIDKLIRLDYSPLPLYSVINNLKVIYLILSYFNYKVKSGNSKLSNYLNNIYKLINSIPEDFSPYCNPYNTLHSSTLPCLVSPHLCKLAHNRLNTTEDLYDSLIELPDNHEFFLYIYNNFIECTKDYLLPIQLPTICFLTDLYNTNNFLLSLDTNNKLYPINFGNIGPDGRICFGNIFYNSYDLESAYHLYLSSYFDLSIDNFVIKFDVNNFLVSFNGSSFKSPIPSEKLSIHSIIPNNTKLPIKILLPSHDTLDFVYYSPSLDNYFLSSRLSLEFT